MTTVSGAKAEARESFELCAADEEELKRCSTRQTHQSHSRKGGKEENSDELASWVRSGGIFRLVPAGAIVSIWNVMSF